MNKSKKLLEVYSRWLPDIDRISDNIRIPDMDTDREPFLSHI